MLFTDCIEFCSEIETHPFFSLVISTQWSNLNLIWYSLYMVNMLDFDLSMCQSVRVSVSLSVCQSVGQSLRQTVSLCVSLSVCMSVCLCLFVCASVYMSDSLSVCQSGFGKTPVPTPKRYLVWIFTIIVNPPNEIHMLRWSNWIGPCVHLFDSSFVWQNVNYRWLFSLTCSYMYCRGKLENAGITVIFLLLCFW